MLIGFSINEGLFLATLATGACWIAWRLRLRRLGSVPVKKPWWVHFGAELFVVVALTDWADGYLARKLNQTSTFGAFLDPVADKLIVAAALILLVELDRTQAWLAMVIIGREITISALREWMAQVGERRSVAAKPQKGASMPKNGDKWIGKYGDARIVLAAPVGAVVWVPQQGGLAVQRRAEAGA